MKITVLGAGCKTCHKQYEYVLKTLEKFNINADVEYITDMEVVSSYGVMTLPAIAVDGIIAVSGKLVKPKEIAKLIL